MSRMSRRALWWRSWWFCGSLSARMCRQPCPHRQMPRGSCRSCCPACPCALSAGWGWGAVLVLGLSGPQTRQSRRAERVCLEQSKTKRGAPPPPKGPKGPSWDTTKSPRREVVRSSDPSPSDGQDRSSSLPKGRGPGTHSPRGGPQVKPEMQAGPTERSMHRGLEPPTVPTGLG